MTKTKLYLVIGVPGSGKTWVCNQLKDKADYISQDLYIGQKLAYKKAIKDAKRVVVTDCPFAEVTRKNELEAMGYNVIPVFIVENPLIVAARYKNREGKPLDPASRSRAGTIVNRAKAWGSYYGTSKAVLSYLLSKV